MKTPTNFSALFVELRDLAAAHQARQAAILGKWDTWRSAMAAAGHHVTTVAPDEVEQAARKNDQQHARARAEVFRRHEGALRHELEERIAELQPLYEALVDQMTALQAFEANAHKFAQQCGVTATPALADPTITSQQWMHWRDRTDRTLHPAPARPRPTPVDVQALLGELS